MIFEANTLVQLISPEVEREGCEIVEVRVRGSSSKPLVQVFIDRDGGVNIELCTRVTRKLTEVLDTVYPEIVQYRLEVSSPGVDRPLKTQKDFKRNLGRTVKITYKENDNVTSIEGEIARSDKNNVYVKSGEMEVQIHYEAIQLARIQLRW